MGFLSLGYRRPAPQPISSVSYQESQGSPDQILRLGPNISAGIPEALHFDKIIDGGTCPPCTVRDFMNYLIYVEHSAENLQFYLWHRDYVTRFHAANTSDLVLAPEWTQRMQEDAFATLQKEHRDGLKRDPAVTVAIFRGTNFEKKGFMNPTAATTEKQTPMFHERNPFETPPRTPAEGEETGSPQFWGSVAWSTSESYRSQAADAFANAGIKAPFTIQPFREEIDRVIATYIMDDAPRQLNLSARERKQLLIALSYTTHPTAFRQVNRSIESTLRLQAHPNFIRWSICNGNGARVKFANFLGAFLIVGSLVAYVLLCLSNVPRGYRAVPAVSMVLGISTQVAALKGMCVVLHGMHHRHVRPWELFVDEEVLDEVSSDGKSGFKKSFDSFGSANSHEDEPWVIKYQKRNLIRKIFDREIWIQEPALRSIQDTIFVQAMLLALLTTGALTAIFVCVPDGRFF